MSTDLVTQRVSDLARAPREHDGQRVVTLADVDSLHGRKKGTARDTFRRVKRRLTEGRHFFRVERARGSNPLARGSGGDMVLVTEAGYLLLVKPLNDDVSWQVQERLVESYFRARDVARALDSSDAVVVSRTDLNRMHADAEQSARVQVRMARWLKQHVSQSARDLNRWRGIGSSARALALEDPDQVRIPGVEFRAVVADLSAHATPEARALDAPEDVDLVALLSNLVTQAVGSALPAALDRALARKG